MSDFRVAGSVRQAMTDIATSRLDAGGGPGELRLYAGTKPPSVDTPLTDQIVLGVLLLSVPAFQAADSSGHAISNPVLPDTGADATGIASFFRLYDASGVALFQGDISSIGLGGDLELNSTAIQAGVEIVVTELTLSLPEAA